MTHAEITTACKEREGSDWLTVISKLYAVGMFAVCLLERRTRASAPQTCRFRQGTLARGSGS